MYNYLPSPFTDPPGNRTNVSIRKYKKKKKKALYLRPDIRVRDLFSTALRTLVPNLHHMTVYIHIWVLRKWFSTCQIRLVDGYGEQKETLTWQKEYNLDKLSKNRWAGFRNALCAIKRIFYIALRSSGHSGPSSTIACDFLKTQSTHL